VIASEGERRIQGRLPGLVYLGFALPLSIFFFRSLQSFMQLLSSRIGVEIVQVFRRAGISSRATSSISARSSCRSPRPAAASGIFPMASFAFLCGYLFQGARWQKALIFLAAAPIAILMNSFRIAITGILANWIGLEVAEGFLHAFEGWLIFCVCLLWLFRGMKLLCLLDGKGRSLVRRLDLTPAARHADAPRQSRNARAAARRRRLDRDRRGPFAIMIGNRSELIPSRADFVSFPRQIGSWQAADAVVDPRAVAALHPSDYLSLNYSGSADLQPVNVWIPYYASQRDGSAAHPPELCIPAGGWTMEKVEKRPFQAPSLYQGRPFELTRIVISQGDDRQLVYYLVPGSRPVRDRHLWDQAHIVRDSVLLQRTDGALVRFVTADRAGRHGVPRPDAVSSASSARSRPSSKDTSRIEPD